MIWLSPFLLPGYLIVLGSYAWMTHRAWQESPVHAILFSLIPPYSIYYSITRWERLKAPSIALLLGWITVLFSFKIIINI
ncbi:hypothetical protein KAR48_08105 [bacterium]|nr:hypothetical protein [bacterium]